MRNNDEADKCINLCLTSLMPADSAQETVIKQQQKQRESKQQRRARQDAQRAHKMAASMLAPCELLLIRHGETDWNRERRLQGQQQPGPPLNDLGWQQAQLVCQVLQERYPQVDAVFTSDLLRTTQTAGVLAAPYSLKVEQHSGLRERHLGLLQGLTYDEAPTAEPEAWAALQSSSSSSKVPGGGESLDELQQRMVETLCDIAARHKGQRVVVVSHGAALHSVHRAARGYTARGKVINCGISVLMVEPTAAAARQQQQQQQQQGGGQHNVVAGAAESSGDGLQRSLQQLQQQGSGTVEGGGAAAAAAAAPVVALAAAAASAAPAAATGTACTNGLHCSSGDHCSSNDHAAAAAAAADAVTAHNGSSVGGCGGSSGSCSNGGSRGGCHLHGSSSGCQNKASGLLKGFCLSGYVDGVNRSCSTRDGCVCREVPGGRLALLTWNDGHLLIEQDMLGAAGISGQFGGSAKEA